MSVSRSLAPERPRTARSAVTNLKRLHHTDAGDGRSSSARRFRDLLASYSKDLGGFDALNEADRSIVRQAASSTMLAEMLQAKMIRGGSVEPDELIRLANVSSRLLATLDKRKPAKPTGHADLRSYLSSRSAA